MRNPLVKELTRIKFLLTDSKASAYKINRIRRCTGFMDKGFPSTYLGCPIYVGRKMISYFDDMVAKLLKD